MDNSSKDMNVNKDESQPNNYLLIIGAMKSGTTSVFEILGQHPQICAAKIKEPDYFTNKRDDKERQDYIDLWDWNNRNHSIALESSVAYTKSPFIKDVPKRIFNSGMGKYRFVYILREPLSRIESQLRHSLFVGWGKSLDEGITEDLIDFSRYAMQIDKYLEFFSKDQILLITLEEFKSQPSEVLKRICDFSEIDTGFNFENVEKPRNPGAFFNASPAVAHLTQKGIGQYVAKKILPIRVKNWVRNIIVKISSLKKENTNLGRWQLNPIERDFILEKLKPDLNRLNVEFNIDVESLWEIPQKYLGRVK